MPGLLGDDLSPPALVVECGGCRVAFLQVGDVVLAVGNPYGLSQTITMGIISAMERSGIGITDYEDFIQTDAAINPGNSGGALVNVKGQLIGINTAIFSTSGGYQGIGFAIPSNTARQVMEQLITKGKVVRGFMGVVPRPLTAAEREKYGVGTGGAMIETVSENTPAARAGLQPEDIVLKINGKPVTDDVNFREVVAATAPGQSLDLALRRAGKEQNVKVTLEAAPDIGGNAAPTPSTGSGKLGLKVEPVTADNARQYNLGDIRTGVVVVQVESGSPADQAGMQPGDVIIRSNGREVASAADLEASVSKAKSGDRIPRVVRREKSRNLVTIEMP